MQRSSIDPNEPRPAVDKKIGDCFRTDVGLEIVVKIRYFDQDCSRDCFWKDVGLEIFLEIALGKIFG